MTRAALVLRPEPGAAATAARLAAAGVTAIRQALFAIAPVAWSRPAERFDALMLTSANAVRSGRAELAQVADLPTIAVGETTAAAACAAGLDVVFTGNGGVASLVSAAQARGFTRLLHLAGRDRVAAPGVVAVTVYASEPLPLPPGAARAWDGQVALLHSARVARRFAALIDRDGVDRSRIAVAALSPAVRDAAGRGWEQAEAAARPRDAALVALAVALIDPGRGALDKRGQ